MLLVVKYCGGFGTMFTAGLLLGSCGADEVSVVGGLLSD